MRVEVGVWMIGGYGYWVLSQPGGLAGVGVHAREAWMVLAGGSVWKETWVSLLVSSGLGSGMNERSDWGRCPTFLPLWPSAERKEMCEDAPQ